MNNDNETNLMAEYTIMQGAINTASQFIIQIFGFSIAAIVALIVGSFQLKNIYLLSGVIVVILSSATYISLQTRLITDTETYIVVFIEHYLNNFKWKQRLFEKHKDHKKENKKAIFARLFVFSDFAALAYFFILISTALLSLCNFPRDWLNYTLSLLFLMTILFFLHDLTKYTNDKYYSKSIDSWKALKQKQETENLKQIQSFVPLQAKLVDSNGTEFPIPESAYQMLHQALQLMASGEAVSVVLQKREVTTREAAELLNMPRPYLIKLLEEGKIPYTKVGLHRYIRFEGVMTYKKQQDIQPREGLRELTQFLQDEGFYEDEGAESNSNS